MGSSSPVGRMTCSASCRDLAASSSPGVAETKIDPVQQGLELVVDQRPVVQRRGEAEPVLHEGKLAGPVPFVHPPHLGQGDVRFVDESKELLGKEVQEHRRPLPFLPAAQVTGIVLDARAVAHLLQHLQVVFRARLDPFRLQELAFVAELLVAQRKLVADEAERVAQALLRHDEVLGRVDGGELHLLHGRARQGIDRADPLDLIAEELDP